MMSLPRVGWSIGAVALLVCLSACHGFDDKRYLPTSPDFINALALIVETSRIPADGFSTTRITATISADAAPSRRTVVFATTKGTFAGSGTPETGRIEVTADSTGSTTVLLRSTTTVETATVTASVKTVDGLAKQALVDFAPINADDVLSFTVASTGMPADGFSRTRLTATVRNLGNPASRNVTFATSKGTLVSSQPTTANGTSVVVPADGNGVAVAELQSSSSVESAFVSATVAGVTKTATVAFTAPDPDAILRLSSAAVSAPADGSTRVAIVATVASGIPSASRTVEFIAGGATFATAPASDPRRVSVVPDASNRAIVDLVAPMTQQTVRVTATVNRVSADALVTFVTALPHRIFVSPASGTVNATTNNVISVSLIRDIGVASVNQIVTYTARNEKGNVVGVFSDARLSTLNATQTLAVSSATYNHAGENPGLVTIEVSVGGVIGRATIQVTGPLATP